MQYCTSFNSTGKEDRGLKQKVFNSKSTMGRRMDMVLKSGSHPDFEGQDLPFLKTAYNSAGMTDVGLKPKVFNSKSP